MSDAFDPAEPSAPATPATPPASPSAMPPGWYDDGTGTQRYWDGAGWMAQPAPYGAAHYAASTPVVATSSDEKTMAMLAHILGILASFLAPLVIYLTKGNESAYVKHHAAEALNFAITVAIAITVCSVLFFLIIPLFLALVIWIGAVVLQIMAGLAANRGEWYRYPINLRLVPGGL